MLSSFIPDFGTRNAEDAIGTGIVKAEVPRAMGIPRGSCTFRISIAFEGGISVGGLAVDIGRDCGVVVSGGVGGAGCDEVACIVAGALGEGGLKREPFGKDVNGSGLNPGAFPPLSFAMGSPKPPPLFAAGVPSLPVALAILRLTAIGLRPEAAANQL